MKRCIRKSTKHSSLKTKTLFALNNAHFKTQIFQLYTYICALQRNIEIKSNILKVCKIQSVRQKKKDSFEYSSYYCLDSFIPIIRYSQQLGTPIVVRCMTFFSIVKQESCRTGDARHARSCFLRTDFASRGFGVRTNNRVLTSLCGVPAVVSQVLCNFNFKRT